MYRVVLADDEAIIRTSIAGLISWEEIGFELIGDAANGKGVLSIMEDYHVDVVLTDVKMPIMDGIGLIKELQKKTNPPTTIVFSAYNDFPIVRKAFKLGAVDYILKSDINKEMLTEVMLQIKKELDKKLNITNKIKKNPITTGSKDINSNLRNMALGKQQVSEEYLYDRYYIACFEVEDFTQHTSRFGDNMQENFINPIINFANQIPRVASKCTFTNISASRYILSYHSEKNEDSSQIKSIAEQIVSVWKNYMNITVSAGISQMGEGSEVFLDCLQESYDCLSMKFIFGKEQIFTRDRYKKFNVQEAISKANIYKDLINSIKLADNEVILEEQRKIFIGLELIPLEEAKKECLNIIYHISIMFVEIKDVIWNCFNQNINFYEKIARLNDIREIEMWFVNFIRWIVDYIETKYDQRPVDVIDEAKRFISDYYFDPSISLGAVAEFVGLNEKYFSTRFSNETGTTFTAYLTDLRIKKAKEMLERTNMKVYEISEAVGYSSVEHFTRVFKRLTGKTPSAYMK